MEIFIIIIVFFVFRWCFHFYNNSRPLEPKEIHQLAKARQWDRFLSRYGFTQWEQEVSTSEKKAMRSTGEFVRCDLDYRTAPAWVAAMLKYKKHEWIVIGFICSFRVKMLWWNKGPDNTKVWSYLSDDDLDAIIEELKPDAIAFFHNHPNPNPGVYSTNQPSQQDLRSAAHFKNQIVSKNRVGFLDFICERGVPHLYYAAFPDREVPIKPITQQIQVINGTGIFVNYRLRKELRRSSISSLPVNPYI